MKITTRLNLIVLVPLLLGGLVCMVVMLNHQRQHDTALCGRVVANIVRGVDRVNCATYDYLLKPDTTTTATWRQANSDLQGTLETSPKLPDGAEAVFEDAMSQQHELAHLFDGLAGVVEPPDGSGPDPARIQDARAAFFSATEAILTSASHMLEDERMSNAGAPSGMRLALVGALTGGMVLFSFVALRRLSGGLRAVQKVLAEWLPLSSTGAPVDQAQGDELDVLAVNLARMTREMRAIRDELNAEVKAREDAAGALRGANVQLSETMSRLRRAQTGILQQERVQALRQIARGVVHDVNDALMPLVGISELYRLYPDQLANHKEVGESFQRIQDAASRAEKVIRNLATFCSPTAAGLSGRVNLSRVVDEVMAASAALRKTHAPGGGAAIEIRTELGPVPDFRGDVPDLADALTAILINAIEAMTEGGVVTLRTAVDGATAIVEVADTGPGMLPEVAQRCLEPFFSTKGKGHSGMGLTAAQGAVTRAGGSLQVMSTLGQGTTVTLRLPMTLAVERDADDGQSLKPSRRLNILAIDDEPWTAHVVERHLKADGHQVRTVTSGKEGVAAALAMGYDVVLLDRVMPDMNGDEVAAALKASHPRLPVIMLTGYGVIMADQGDTPPGVDYVLSKPVKQADLRRAILRVMKS